MDKRKKDYDIVGFLLILITIMMIALTLNIFFVNNEVIVAQAESEISNDTKEREELKESFFLHIMNKSMSILEINFKESGGENTTSFVKGLLANKINFDYNKPKSLIKSQIPLIKDFESHIQLDDDLPHSEDYDSHDIFIAKENINESEEKPTNSGSQSYEENNLYEDDIQVINMDPQDANNEENSNQNNENQGLFNEVEIVSTPAPAPKEIQHQADKPLIFIYHTHGTESYSPEKVGNYHSLNRKYTVRRIGELMKNNLENAGFKVIHDDTLHDYPSYEGSYVRSLETLNKNLKNNPSLKVVFDVHRDGINNIDELATKDYEAIRERNLVEINGEKVATYSMVIGGGNENLEELKRFAYFVKAISDEMYPGFASKIILKESKSFKYKLNQYKSDYYILFEIGNNANNIYEAERTAAYLSQVINQALRKFVVKSN
ncbi:stage II sporulation protein P [Maledivibacter halophilus]|uniref:Stage II sporulation protein P n=1 Tax=Maledivibacter halophilus TaxID=36842 RepID=A0A1T5LVV3_9FIRM|nr:stage II sporulation protein P [Maledivibacter halophilus]SKC79718.1 stage II sporulation protein P [Maledivibacter halophilus]